MTTTDFQIELGSLDATTKCAAALGQVVEAGTAIGLVGDLGAGKTTFVQALARGLGVPESTRVTSPTFTLVNEYPGGRVPLIHSDLYRLERDQELDELGLFEALDDPVVVVIEWCDKFRVLPEDHLRLELSIAGEHSRSLRGIASGPHSLHCLAAWREALAPAAEPR